MLSLDREIIGINNIRQKEPTIMSVIDELLMGAFPVNGEI